MTNECLHAIYQLQKMNLVCVSAEKKFHKRVPDNVQSARSIWQEAVRMTNEDLCTRIRTASEDSHVLLSGKS